MTSKHSGAVAGMARNLFRRFILYRLGYWYFAFIFLLLLSLLVVALYNGSVRPSMVTVGIIIFLMGRGFFEAMRTKVPAPEGLEITADEAPELFQLIGSVTSEVGSPRIDNVKLDNSLNAYIAEIPRWGALGPYKRYLVLGVPLLLVLSVDEFKAVLAHEVAHLSNAHGKTAFRIHRAADVWQSIAEQFKKSGRERDRFVWPFLVRYIPALRGEAYAHSRENEFVADSVAARIAGPKAAASGLLKLPLYDSYLDKAFWRGVFQQIKSSERPPDGVFLEMEAFCEAPLQVEKPKEVLDRLMTVRSIASSTHPSYAERLAHMGVEPEWPAHAKPNALRALLRESGSELLQRASAWWADATAEMWSVMRQALEEAESKLRSLEEKAASGADLSLDEAVESALLLERVEGVERGFEAFRALHADHPDDVAVLFHTGRLLIQTGDLEGEELLVKVVEKDPQTIPECCAILYSHYRSKGDLEQAHGYYQYAVSFMTTNEQVREERTSIRLSHEFRAHDLRLEDVERIRTALEEKGYVRRAYIITKQLEFSAAFPLYLVAVKLKAFSRSKRVKLVGELAQIGLMPWDYYVVPIYGRNRELEYKAAVLPGARVL